jgi:hypothetical protein
VLLHGPTCWPFPWTNSPSAIGLKSPTDSCSRRRRCVFARAFQICAYQSLIPRGSLRKPTKTTHICPLSQIWEQGRLHGSRISKTVTIQNQHFSSCVVIYVSLGFQQAVALIFRQHASGAAPHSVVAVLLHGPTCWPFPWTNSPSAIGLKSPTDSCSRRRRCVFARAFQRADVQNLIPRGSLRNPP